MNKNIFHQSGLTLLELLISLVIISVVITLCVSGFTFGNKVWAKVDEHQNNLDDVTSTHRFLRKVLSEAVFYPFQEGEKRNKYFSGDANKMIFLASSPQYGLDDYLYIYEIFKQKQNGILSLKVRYLPANSYFSGKVRFSEREVRLIKNVKSIRFEYFGLDQRTGVLNWYESWLNQSAIPTKVSITIEPILGSAEWPPLIVETRYGAYVLP